MVSIPKSDIEALIRDKYDGDRTVDLSADIARLEADEPLAYVIGWIPFLGARINLGSCPLIPRPETEWWTQQLITHVQERFRDEPFALLDLCAGSGAIGIAVLKALPNAHVSFGEIDAEHAETIRQNIKENGIAESRTLVLCGDLLEPFEDLQYNFIVSNPPYIPETRPLDESVLAHEPRIALYAGNDGLDVIRRIAHDAPGYLCQDSELWVECDIANIKAAESLVVGHGANSAEIRTDLYGRPRVVVGYYA